MGDEDAQATADGFEQAPTTLGERGGVKRTPLPDRLRCRLPDLLHELLLYLVEKVVDAVEVLVEGAPVHVSGRGDLSYGDLAQSPSLIQREERLDDALTRACPHLWLLVHGALSSDNIDRVVG